MSGQLKVRSLFRSSSFKVADLPRFVQVKGNIMLATKLDTVLKSAQAKSKA